MAKTQVAYYDVGTGISPSTIYFSQVTSSPYTLTIYKLVGSTYTKITALETIPTKSGYTFGGLTAIGYNWNSFEVCDATGTFLTTPSGEINTTQPYFYGIWNPKAYTLTFNDGSGTGGAGVIYASVNGDGWFTDSDCTQAVQEPIAVPTLEGSKFLGYYSAASGGTKYVNADGSFTSDFESLQLSANTTFYAQYEVVFTAKITFSLEGGTAGTPGIWYNSNTGKYFSDAACTTEITTQSITPPTRAGNDFLGYYSAASGGTQYIDEDGAFTADFPTPTSDLTFYAQWELRALVAYLDANGGSGSPATIFYKNGWFSDEECTQSISSIAVPTRSGYTYQRFDDDDGNTVIDGTGAIVLSSITEDVTATAVWSALSYTLTFDFNGGSGTPATKTVTSGQAIGTLPTPTHPTSTFVFDGWKIDGNYVTATTVWDYAANKTAVASWETPFKRVVDFFNLSSSSLIAVASSEGQNRVHQCAYNATADTTATDTSGKWLNPTVEYLVASNTAVSVQLGKGFAAASSDVSGYMITSVTVSTGVGQPPRVIVSGTANEGADAVVKYNVSFPVTKRHRPQNILYGVGGSGDLQSYEITATCDPVVVAENGMPCASDVTHGRIEISATVNSYNDEGEPTAGVNFTNVETTVNYSDAYWKVWNVKNRKELVA